MANLNRYKFTFGEKQLTLTTEHDNLFMEEIERLAQEKYAAIKAEMPHADTETLAILLAVNSLSVSLLREIELEKSAQAPLDLTDKEVTAVQGRKHQSRKAKKAAAKQSIGDQA